MGIIYTPLLATQLLEIYKGKEETMNGMWQRLIYGRINQPATRISRRAVIMGAAAAITGVIVGESTFWLTRHLLRSIPQGTLFVTYRGHSDVVRSARWSPDGKHIASASDDGTVQVWNADNGSRILTYRGHSSLVYSAAWSPDGKHIASASDDHTVQVWDASNGGQLFTYRGHSDDVISASWSPDGKRIASASQDYTV